MRDSSEVRVSSALPFTARPNLIKSAALRHLLTDKVTLLAFFVLLLVTVLTLGADLVAGNLLGQQRDTIDLVLVGQQPFPPPFPAGVGGHILGTDELARDMLARTIYAGQVSLSVGYLTALIAVVVGAGLGMLAGYLGGWVDTLVGALMQILVNIPLFFLMIILSFVVIMTVPNISLLIGLLSWVGTARLVRGQVLGLKYREYVDAARVMGASNLRIMVKHILPNVLSTMLVVVGFDISGAILTEAGLSYLQFGVVLPVPSWGNLLAGSIRATSTPSDGTLLFERNIWLFLLPAASMVITLTCIYLVTGGIRDAFDPRLRREK
ncbi:MAG: ABC transporter permease [Chloroflexi bacterium]|nr:ABC transporter permease [Chloroflexota bacterium]